MDKTLNELGLKHGTDKSTFHFYTRHYQEILEPLVRDRPSGSLVELGFLRGASARMWREWLPDSWTVDFVEIEPVPDEDQVDGVTVWQGSQSGPQLAQRINKVRGGDGFDVVIDDASHEVNLTEASVWVWWPLVKPGGWYIIEDTITSGIRPTYNGGAAAHGMFRGGIGVGQRAVPAVSWEHPDGPGVMSKLPGMNGQIFQDNGGGVAEVRILPNMTWLRKASDSEGEPA